MSISYTKTTWVNGSQPAISAENLNKIETGIKNVTDETNNKQDKFAVVTIQNGEANLTSVVGGGTYFDNTFFAETTSLSGDNQKRIVNIEMLKEHGTIKQDKFATVEKTGSGAFETVDIVPDTSGTAYLYGKKLQIYYDTLTEYSFNGQAINGLVLAKALSLFLPGYDGTKTQVIKNVNGTIRWVDEV